MAAADGGGRGQCRPRWRRRRQRRRRYAAGNGATAQELLADWRKRNLVQTGHRRITVIDPAALRRLGGLGP
jgi:hypothetical protein